MNIKDFIRPDIVDMQPYKPIVPFEVLSRQLGRPPEEIVKLDANENPYGPAPKAIEALQAGNYFHIYPDPAATELREALGRYNQIDPDHLLVGMGADELIDLVLRVVLSPQDIALDSPPSFGMYPFSTAVNSGRYLTINRQANFQIDIDAIEEAVHSTPNIKVIFACAPNNPDGGMISEEDLQRLLALPALIILDEAYIEFAAVDGWSSHLNWVEQHDNLCVLRTFSKLAGLAGLRVGYGSFPAWLREQMMKIKQPYNVNVAANLAAIGALQDSEWLQAKVEALVAERKKMTTALAQFDYLTPLPSFSNFVLCEVNGRDAGQLKQQLQNEHGVLVRHYNKPLLSNYIRISAGRPDQTVKLLQALQAVQ